MIVVQTAHVLQRQMGAKARGRGGGLRLKIELKKVQHLGLMLIIWI